MAVLTPVGQIRHNSGTGMSEVWDGKQWVQMDDGLNGFTTINTYSAVPNGGHTITNVSSNGISSVSTMNDNLKEDLYSFLKRNLRVAEYTDETGKLDYVQLEMREGDGGEWENIQRVRIKQ
jgi:hypothetical protein